MASTNTHVPAPYWAAVSPVCIPLSTCNRAADALIDWFGPEELKQVVGGERWWQVRGLNGVDGEWITEKSYLSEEDVDVGRKLSREDENIIRMEKLETVMVCHSFRTSNGGANKMFICAALCPWRCVHYSIHISCVLSDCRQADISGVP